MGDAAPVITSPRGPLDHWAQQILSRDRRAIARAISLIENQDEKALELLKALYPHAGNAFVIGITGAPGVGKSTLLEKLALTYRRGGSSVGIVTVDPSSPFTQGALLGDRIRMQALSTDDQVYIRSMATRGALGGLTATTADVVTVLDAAGFEVVLVETVGVGQDEVEIAQLADVVVLLLTPNLGDEIQAFKAGVMEIADIWVINKADLPNSNLVAEQLTALQMADPKRDSAKPAVVKTVGTTGQGIEELHALLTGFQTRALSPESRRARRRRPVEEIVCRKMSPEMAANLKRNLSLDRGIEDALEQRRGPYSLAQELLALSNRDHTSAQFAGGRIHHIAIAVKSLAEAAPIFEKMLGCEHFSEEFVAEQKVRVMYLQSRGCLIELLEPTSPDSPVAQFLSRRGPGMHHLALAVRNLGETLKRLQAEGYELVDREPRLGAAGAKIAFLHPRSTAGVLVELREEGARDSDDQEEAGS